MIITWHGEPYATTFFFSKISIALHLAVGLRIGLDINHFIYYVKPDLTKYTL